MEVLVLLSNVFSNVKYPVESIIKLYFRRWKVEEHDGNEKTYLDIECFHSCTKKGIRQELFAVLVICVIARAHHKYGNPVESGAEILQT